MARIALAWELGGEMGHAGACVTLAHTLLLRGHQVGLFFGSLEPLQHLDAQGCEVFEAPHGMRERLAAKPASYAEVLLACGYEDAQALRPLAEGWRALLASWRPDVVVADFAPTAHLAARALGIPRVSFGNGFLVPPREKPMPSFRFVEAIDGAKLAAFDAAATASINAVLAQWSQPPVESVAGILDADDEFLCTFPELDHYGSRAPSGYWGPRFNTSSGIRAAWPARARKRIFAYVKPQHPALPAILEALATAPFAAACFVPGLTPQMQARFRGGRFNLSGRPLRLEGLLPECDLVIGHGGEMTGGTLMQGIPQLVFPIQFEQFITAQRVVQTGAGVMFSGNASAREVAGAITETLGNPRYRQAAAALAHRYPAYSPKEQRRRMAVRIEQLAILPGTRNDGATA